MHLGGLADDLGRRECATANDGQQRRRNDGDTLGDLTGEFVDLRGQHTQVLDQPQGQPAQYRRITAELQMGGNCVTSAGALHLCRSSPPGIEFMQMPTQPGDDPGPLGDEIFAVINQQPQLTLHTVEAPHR